MVKKTPRKNSTDEMTKRLSFVKWFATLLFFCVVVHLAYIQFVDGEELFGGVSEGVPEGTTQFSMAELSFFSAEVCGSATHPASVINKIAIARKRYFFIFILVCLHWRISNLVLVGRNCIDRYYDDLDLFLKLLRPCAFVLGQFRIRRI